MPAHDPIAHRLLIEVREAQTISGVYQLLFSVAPSMRLHLREAVRLDMPKHLRDGQGVAGCSRWPGAIAWDAASCITIDSTGRLDRHSFQGPR